jgi:DNA-binding transcriptional MerR regulator
MSADETLLPGDIPDKLYFRIGEVASTVGVEPHVLRYWEGEFALKPLRSMSGQRLYRKQDIARFLRIRHLLHEKGFTVAGARKFLKSSPGVQPGISPEAVREAVGRIADVRARLAALQAEARPLWES